MHGIAEGFIQSETPLVFGDKSSISVKAKEVGIHAPLHAFVGVGARYAVPIAIKVHQALRADPYFLRYTGIKGERRFDQKFPLLFENAVDVPLAHFWMPGCFGIRDGAFP